MASEEEEGGGLLDSLREVSRSLSPVPFPVTLVIWRMQNDCKSLARKKKKKRASAQRGVEPLTLMRLKKQIFSLLHFYQYNINQHRSSKP
jgi:hypothetical protein